MADIFRYRLLSRRTSTQSAAPFFFQTYNKTNKQTKKTEPPSPSPPPPTKKSIFSSRRKGTPQSVRENLIAYTFNGVFLARVLACSSKSLCKGLRWMEHKLYFVQDWLTDSILDSLTEEDRGSRWVRALGSM